MNISIKSPSLSLYSVWTKHLIDTPYSSLFSTTVALGVFFYLKEEGEAPGWLPLTSLMMFIASFSLGYGPIPWVLMGE